MKVIKLNESQFQRLIEGNNEAPSFNNGDIKEYPGSEISTTTTITNANGDTEYGEQPTSDEFANQQTTQNYYASSMKNPRLTKIF